MTLACHGAYAARFDLMEAIVWSIGLLMPVATFLFMPKLLPLARELRWSRIKAQLPLAWLASSTAERTTLRSSLRASWQAELEATHGAGTRLGEVVRTPHLLRRARLVGWGVASLVLGVHGLLAALILHSNDNEAGRVVVGVMLTGVVASWIARAGATGAAAWAQSLALGRSPLARLGLGVLIGGGYGAVCAFTVGFVGIAVIVPALSLLTLSAPGSHEVMIALTIAATTCSLFGALVGASLLAPLSLFTRRR